MDRPTPLGFYDEHPAPDGTAPYAGCSMPGPRGTATDRVIDWPAGSLETADRGSLSLPFAVGADTYRLRRVDTELRLGSNEIMIPAPEALAIIERAARQHRENVPLLRLLETAPLRLGGSDHEGILILVRLRPEKAGRVAVSAGSSTPPVPRPRPVPAPAAVVESPKTHKFALKLLTLPDVKPRSAYSWWPPRPPDYANTPYAADITDGHHDGSLDGAGSMKFEGIPGGSCKVSFATFYDDVKVALTPE